MGKQRKLMPLTPYGLAAKQALLGVEITQEQLAQELGTSSAYLNLIFRGYRSGTKWRPLINARLGLKGWEGDVGA